MRKSRKKYGRRKRKFKRGYSRNLSVKRGGIRL